MKNFVSIYSILFLTVLLFCRFQCDDNDYFPYKQSKIKLSSTQQIHSLEDTLWLSTTFVDFNYSASKFPFSLSVKGAPVEFAPQQTISSSININHFDDGSDITFQYGCPTQDSLFTFNLGIIFSNKGLYALSLNIPEVLFFQDNIPCDSLGDSAFEYGDMGYIFDVDDTNLELYYNNTFSELGLLGVNGEKQLLQKRAFTLKID